MGRLVCLYVARPLVISLKGVPGEGFNVPSYSLSLGTLEEVPEEGLFVFVSLSPGVFRKETQRKAKLSVIVSCVICLLVF